MANTNAVVLWVREEEYLVSEVAGAEEVIRQRRLDFLVAAEAVLSKLSNLARWRLNASVSDEYISQEGDYFLFYWADKTNRLPENEQPVRLILEKLRVAAAISEAAFRIKCLMHNVKSGFQRGGPVPAACLDERRGSVIVNGHLTPFSYLISGSEERVCGISKAAGIDEVVSKELLNAMILVIQEDKVCVPGLRACVIVSR